MPTYTTNSLCYMVLPALLSKSSVTSAELLNYINKAEYEINAKLANRYDVPITSGCPILEAKATDLAIYYAMRRTFSGEKKNESEWPRAYKDAMDFIDDVSAGKIPLINSAGAIIAQKTSVIEVWSNNQDYNPTFTEDDPLNQVDDSQKIKDIRDDRSADLGWDTYK